MNNDNDNDNDAGPSAQNSAAWSFDEERQMAGESGYRAAFGAGFDLDEDSVDNADGVAIDESAVAGLPDYRITGRDTPVDGKGDVISLAGYRKEEKGHFFNTLSYNTGSVAGVGEKGGATSGNPVIRQSGEAAPLADDDATGADVNPIGLLPRLLHLSASSLARTRNISPMSAAVAWIAGASSALGKGVHVVTFGEQVHPNLQILMAGPTGNRKKPFHSPVDQVVEVLRKIENESKTEARRHQSELRKAEKSLESARGANSREEIEKCAALIGRLQGLSNARSLAFGDDATAPMIARQLVKQGGDGGVVVNSQEGTMFLSRVAGNSKGDTGYGALLTKGFNDPEYSFSRYDEGRETHGGVRNPRLFLTLSIQNQLVPSVIERIPKALGVFQRFNYVVEEQRRILDPSATLFGEKPGADPARAASSEFIKSVTRKCWSVVGESIELRFSGEAMARLDLLMRDNESRVEAEEKEDGEWAGYMCRWTEQVIKLVQTFHVATCADSRTGEVDWGKVGQPIPLETVERAIAFHALWQNHTRLFYERWIRPVRTGIEGLSCERVKSAMFKAMEKSAEGSRGVQGSDILKYLPKGTTSKEFIEVVDGNPDHFAVIMVGDRGKKLYLPRLNVVDIAFNTEREEGLDAA